MKTPIDRFLRLPPARSALRWLGRALFAASTAVLLVGLGNGAAAAAEARPWLCRDKPAMSSSERAQLVVTRHDRRQWQFFLMKLAPGGGGHDGFTVIHTYRLYGASGPRVTGTISRGEYFAVALYHGTGGHWICAGEVDDNTRPGEVANICYSAVATGSCDVSLNASLIPR